MSIIPSFSIEKLKKGKYFFGKQRKGEEGYSTTEEKQDSTKENITKKTMWIKNTEIYITVFVVGCNSSILYVSFIHFLRRV